MSLQANKILVISDIHFGEGHALLKVRHEQDVEGRARVDGLLEWLSDQGPFQEIVLLGDVWELWTASFEEAVAESRYFLSRLCELEAEKILFVPGNHDHHLLIQHQLVEQILTMRDDHDLEVPAQTQRSFNDSHLARLLPPEARKRFVVSYPDHFASIGNKQIVFHHGHHATILQPGPSIFSSIPLFILRRLEEVGLHDLTRSDLELGCTIFFELMYAMSRGQRTRAKMNASWERFLTLKTSLSSLSARLLHPLERRVTQWERGTVAQDVARYTASINRLLTLAEEEHKTPIPCDAYIFGHTHRAGITRIDSPQDNPRLLANSGTWLYEPGKNNRVSEGTFLILDDAHIILYRQGADLAIRPLDIVPWPEPSPP